MAVALADCITKVADSANVAMGTTDQRERLLFLVNKFVEERPDCVKTQKRSH